MASVILFHHLGLGDHIMCHGIVREYCKRYDRVALFCLPHYYPSVSFMFRDLPNLTVLKGDNAAARSFIFKNSNDFGPGAYDEVRLVGFQDLNWQGPEQLEKQFYAMADVPFEKKWDSFHVDRDPAREAALESKVKLPQTYAFVHEDVSRGFGIKRELIGADCTVFLPDKNLTDNVFDYCGIIERAAEIHVIDSSFMFLVDCLPYNNADQKLFIHRYSRQNDPWKLPILKKDWQVIGAAPGEETLMTKASHLLGSILPGSATPPAESVYDAFLRTHLSTGITHHAEGLSHTPDPLGLVRSWHAAGGTMLLSTPCIPEYADHANGSVFYPGMSESERIKWNRNTGAEKDVTTHVKPESGPAHWYWGLTPSALESLLGAAGFEVTEHCITPYSAAFVCKAK